MEKFIVGMIEKYSKSSLEEGQDLYRKYFINTDIYKGYKSGVDKILKADGYADVIVKK